MIIAHLSDPHLGERPANAPRLHQIALHIRARHDSGEEIAAALTGDLTHDGLLGEWHALHEALQPLIGVVPIFAVPGNHDVGALGITFDPKRALQARAGLHDINTTPARIVHGLRVWEWAGCKILGLDSTRGQEGELLPPLARGEIGLAQLAALEVELQDEQPTVVLLHHHPLWDEALHVLEDAAALKALIERRPQVKAVLFGHQHKEAVWGTPKTRLWVSSGKSTEARGGRLRYREFELEASGLLVCRSTERICRLSAPKSQSA